jgi:hypothetical protein
VTNVLDLVPTWAIMLASGLVISIARSEGLSG